MDDLTKLYDTCSMLYQALCIISKPPKWSYSPETLNLRQNQHFLAPYHLEIWWMILKTIGHLFCATSSFVYHFIGIGQFKLEL